MQQLPSRTRVRIHSHVTRSRFLHVEDALAIGKIRLFAGVYERDRGLIQHLIHFVDIADARVVFGALVNSNVTVQKREVPA